jgi:hypothetical protein
VKDPDHGVRIQPVLVRIRCLAENGLTTLMVLHDFLSKRLVPLQDRPRLTWMYTGVNNIMRLHHRPGDIDEDLSHRIKAGWLK